MPTLPYAAVPYDRYRHAPFVYTSWCRGTKLPDDVLCAHLRRPETRCLVAHVPGDEDSLLGWAAVQAGAVVYVYVRDLYGRVRRRGVATSLLLDAGADVSEPTPCLYWSPYAALIAARGYRIYYAPKGSHEMHRNVHPESEGSPAWAGASAVG